MASLEEATPTPAGGDRIFIFDRHRRLLEANNLDRGSGSLKTNIKFAKEVRLPKD